MHLNGVNSVAVFPSGDRVVSGSEDKTLMLWDVSTDECLATWKGHSNDVSSVAVFPSGDRVVSGSHDKTLKLWGAASQTLNWARRRDPPLWGKGPKID